MSELVMVEIPLDDIKKMIRIIDIGIRPKVSFCEDIEEMRKMAKITSTESLVEVRYLLSQTLVS